MIFIFIQLGYFSDKSKWEIRTLDDFYISVNKKDQEVTDSLFIYVKDSKDISHKVIDFEMVFGETYNLFFTNPPKANQREILRTIVLEIKDKIEKWERLINLNNNGKLVPLDISEWLELKKNLSLF